MAFCLIPYAVSSAEALAPPLPDEREHLVIVGSTLVSPFLAIVSEQLSNRIGLPPAEILPAGSSAGLRQFCTGVGVDTPDILALSRRMRKNELDACTTNVGDIIRITLGYDALVVVSRINDPLALTLNDLYLALAAEVPSQTFFEPNPNRLWNEIRKDLPAEPIGAFLPAPQLGLRGFLEDRVFQAACRAIPQIRGIFDASSRVKQCLAMRGDGVIQEIGLPFVDNVRAAMEHAPTGTIAVIGLSHAEALSDLVQIVELDGQSASKESIHDNQYQFVRPLNIYIKKAHIKDFRGVGPVHGLREFITEITREETIGSDGYLTEFGLIPLNPETRETNRTQALRLQALR